MLRRAIGTVAVVCLIISLVAVVSPSFRLSIINMISPPGPANINTIPGGRFAMPDSPPANLDGLLFTNVEPGASSEWQAEVEKQTDSTSNSFSGTYGLPGQYSGGPIPGFYVSGAEPSADEAALQSYLLTGVAQGQSANQPGDGTWTTWAPPPTSLGNTFRCSLNVQPAFAAGTGRCIWYNGFEVISLWAPTTSLTSMEALIETVVSELHS